jgi:hypothetical protein
VALGNVNYDSILSTTLANYRTTLEDNAFTTRPLTAWLRRKDRMKLIDGGAKIVEPLMYAQNQAAGSYSGYDTLPLTASAGITAAEFNWKQYAATIAINGLEEAENAGQEAIIDLLESKVTQAEETIAEQMDIMFLAAGQGNSGKDWWGLQSALAGFDVTQNGTPFGGISLGVSVVPTSSGATASQNQWWQPYVDYGTTGTVQNQTVNINGVPQIVPLCYAPATQLATALATTDMAHAYNLASRGNDSPDFAIGGQRVFEKYESLLTPNMRYTDTVTADGGFQNLLFKTCPIMFDVNMVDYLPGAGTSGGSGSGSQLTNSLYFLNSKYLKVKGHKSRWFSNSPFKMAPNQDARYAQVFVYGNLTASNRMRHAVMLNRF